MRHWVLWTVGVMAAGCGNEYACKNDAKCRRVGDDFPYCASVGMCVECLSDADCVGNANGPECVGLGYCSDSEDAPSDHTLASDQSSGEFGYYHGFGFTLPETATVSFEAASPDSDYYGVAIFTAAQWSAFRDNTSEQYTCCLHQDDTVVDDSTTLSAGEWYLGFWCRNSVYNCTVEYDVNALY